MTATERRGGIILWTAIALAALGEVAWVAGLLAGDEGQRWATDRGLQFAALFPSFLMFGALWVRSRWLAVSALGVRAATAVSGWAAVLGLGAWALAGLDAGLAVLLAVTPSVGAYLARWRQKTAEPDAPPDPDRDIGSGNS